MQSTFVLDKLRQEILNGAMPPGTVLLQSQIAKQFDVSRIPVRDALAVLAAEKLVVVTPNHGAQVVKLTLEELNEVYDLRIMLETHCIKAAIAQANAKEIDTIQYYLKISSVEAGRDGWAESDWNFHKSLYAPSNKTHHIRVIRELRQLCQIHVSQYQNLRIQTDLWLSQHEEIVLTYQGKDAHKCSLLLKTHLTDAKDVLIKTVQN